MIKRHKIIEPFLHFLPLEKKIYTSFRSITSNIVDIFRTSYFTHVYVIQPVYVTFLYSRVKSVYILREAHMFFDGFRTKRLMRGNKTWVGLLFFFLRHQRLQSHHPMLKTWFDWKTSLGHPPIFDSSFPWRQDRFMYYILFDSKLIFSTGTLAKSQEIFGWFYFLLSCFSIQWHE